MVKSLSALCLEALLLIIEANQFHPRVIKYYCKVIPDHLLEPLLQALLRKGVITDVALTLFLLPSRSSLELTKLQSVRNATFKQIGYNCPNLLSLNISDCIQIGNSVVQCVLQGCRSLECLILDRCHRVTDAAFDVLQSPFQPFVAYFSLKSISLQGCPQVTGDIVPTLNKHCGRLKHLNLSQCKQIRAEALQSIFDHHALRCLNLAFIDNLTDEILMMPTCWSSSSPLTVLNMGKSRITDLTMFRMAFLSELQEVRIPWCSEITDVGVMALTRHCPQLRLIDLKSCGITDDAVRAIASGSKLLEELDLSWCVALTDAGLLWLAAVGQADQYQDTCSASRLKILSVVWCCQLTDASIVTVCQLPSLLRLDLTGCSGVSSACKDAGSSAVLTITS